jgi:hypothetical protein
MTTPSTAWIFPLDFQLHYLLEETCFQQGGSSVVEGTNQVVLGSSSDHFPIQSGFFQKQYKT